MQILFKTITFIALLFTTIVLLNSCHTNNGFKHQVGDVFCVLPPGSELTYTLRVLGQFTFQNEKGYVVEIDSSQLNLGKAELLDQLEVKCGK